MAFHLSMSAVLRPRTDAVGGDMDNSFILCIVASAVIRTASRICKTGGLS